MSCRRHLSLVALLVLSNAAAFATETDQFTVPATPLHEIGPALSQHVVELIESDRSGRTPEQILSKFIGSSIFSSRLAKWARKQRTGAEPVTFRPRVLASIFRTVLSPMPGSFWFAAPTVHVHGYYFGTDKIDHIFRQGYTYYQIVTRKEAEGASRAAGIAAAVAYGVKQEHTYFGTAASGIYSNADLAANYAGMMFYLNLRQPVVIGDRTWPPLFEGSAGAWRLRPGVAPDEVLVRFLSNHLDESLNPSRYAFSRGSLRARVRERCSAWTHFYADRLEFVADTQHSFARRWFGEDYGHWLPPREEVSIATECSVPPRASERLTAESRPAPRDRSGFGTAACSSGSPFNVFFDPSLGILCSLHSQ